MNSQYPHIILRISIRVRLTLLFGLIVSSNNIAYSQQIQFNTIWDYQIGSTTIEDLIQDEIGFIWVATQAGLIRGSHDEKKIRIPPQPQSCEG